MAEAETILERGGKRQHTTAVTLFGRTWPDPQWVQQGEGVTGQDGAYLSRWHAIGLGQTLGERSGRTYRGGYQNRPAIGDVPGNGV